MTLLRDISALWSLLHTLVLFVLLFESRYPRKRTMAITLFTMIPLLLINFALFIYLGAERLGQILLLTCTLPSLIVFWILAKNRDGRFFFTFCLADTLSLEIMYLTNIIEFFIPGETYIFMFVSRMLAYPIIELLFFKKIRPMYLNVQKHIKKGWYIFAGISAIFYLAITLLMSYPTIITQRLEHLPAFLLLLLLMPILYLHIFNTLRIQQRAYEATVQESILRFQTANLKSRIDEYSAADGKFRMERHNFRHKMQTIANLAETGQYDALRTLVHEYSEAIEETKVRHYCENVVLDAVFSSYFQQAENRGISVLTRIQMPEALPAGDAELAAAFANGIENAIHACEKLPEEKRYIEVRTLVSPRFMIQISNSFDGNIEFSSEGIPVSRENGHGLGTRSIIAFCEKHGAHYEFKADAEKFSLRIGF